MEIINNNINIIDNGKNIKKIKNKQMKSNKMK